MLGCSCDKISTVEGQVLACSLSQDFLMIIRHFCLLVFVQVKRCIIQMTIVTLRDTKHLLDHLRYLFMTH